MKSIEFHVDGEPRPQPRSKARAMIKKLHTGRLVPVGHVYSPGDADDWKAMIALAARDHVPVVPIASAVELRLRIHLPRPQSLYRAKDPPGPIPHTAAGDADNFAKPPMDIFTQLGFWIDDKQVSDLIVRKRWAAKGLRPGMDVEIIWDETAPTVAVRGAKSPRRSSEQPALPLDDEDLAF